jgi:poly(hydroxyalkanoate) depolymerase family esterase
LKLSRLARPWARAFQRSVKAALKPALKPPRPAARPAAGTGSWQPGLALGAGTARRYRVYRPPGVALGQRLPLLVMLHGCGQDAQAFADSTRMNALARRQGFVVLYPEQERLANPQGCWNWFDTKSGRAQAEAASIMATVDQACLLHGADRDRVAVAGLSAGASMAALLATRYPERFRAVAMHSGVPTGTANSTLTALGAMHGRRATAALAPPLAGAAGLPPLLVLQGLADTVVAPANAQAAVRIWAEASAAQALPRRYAQRGKRYPVAITDFKHGRRLCATLVEVAALGHAWSGGAARRPFSDARGPDASRMIWAFVRSALAS